jgi:hypothetical protein
MTALIDVLVNLPLVGVAPEDPRTAHRVESIAMSDWGTAEYAVAVCGEFVKLVPCRWEALRTRGTENRRCRECRVWRRPKKVKP